jgi:putative proteasome-type protease
MTYCVGILLDTGLVFLADSRTNAGVDQINTFRKVTVFERRGERALVLMNSGNLAISQSVAGLLHETVRNGDDRPSLMNAPNLFEAARRVGDAVREVHRRDGSSLKDFGVDFAASFILGGQVRGEMPRLFKIYAAGNFIEATPETTYFQIGDAAYGKPIIDRVIRRSTSLPEATKCALVSMDSTIRSNLTVGPPLDLVIVRRDHLEIDTHVNIESDNEYFQMVRKMWSSALREAFSQLPDPDFLGPMTR